MRGKFLAVLLVSVVLTSISVIAKAQNECPTCRGTGKIQITEPCPTCNGSPSSSAQANVRVVGSIQEARVTLPGGPGTSLTGTFHNYGAAGVTGTVTGTIKENQQNGKTYTNTSSSTYFPPGEDVSVNVIVAGIRYETWLACFMTFNGAETASCPTCQGLGYINQGQKTCTNCGGTGVVNGGVGGNFNLEGVGGAVAGIVAVGAVAAVGFFVVKKRRVSEQSLRRLSSFEFQDWVTKRIFANPATQKDVYLGIDAYTAEGYPVQIRQDDVGKRAIDSFAAAMARNKARTGTIIAFGFGSDAAEGVMKARLNYKLEVKTVTVKELLARKDRIL